MKTFPPSPLAGFSDQFITTQGVIAVHASPADLDRLVTHALVSLANQRERVAVIAVNTYFDSYGITRLAREQYLNPQSVRQQIQVVHADTIYQVQQGVQRLATSSERFSNIFVLKLLEPFFNKRIAPVEAQKVLTKTLDTLQELGAHRARVLITVPPAKNPTRSYLIAQVERMADSYIQIPTAAQPIEPMQAALF
ncbi:MAG TPA: hypothetical protein VFD70_24595 [Anaerolineae bacterium]|nr:hypothetical protein [Anaerolineae bacterium]